MPWPLAAWMLGAVAFFHRSFFSAFDLLGGDAGDTRLYVYLQEHWLNVLRGDVSWTSPAMFYPAKGTLGFSDTSLLNSVFYIPLRAVGADPFLAFQWTLVALSAVGFASAYRVLRSHFGLALLPACLMAASFAFANGLAVKVGHPQLLAIHWVALAAMVTTEGVGRRGRRRAVLLACGGALFGLAMYSAYYIAWFALFATVVTSLWWTSMWLWSQRRLGAEQVWAVVVSQRGAFGSWLGGFAVAMAPFAITYLPVLGRNGGREYAEVVSLAPRPGDVVNLGNDNLLWSGLLRQGLSTSRLANVEVSVAATPLLMIAAVVIAVLAVRSRPPGRGRALAACALAASAVTVTLLPVQFGWGSMWQLIRLVPGAVAIRASGRILLIATPLALLAIAAAWPAVATSRRRSAALSLTLALVAFEQLNRSNNYFVDRSEEIRALIIAPPPPAECSAMYIVLPAGSTTPYYEADIDAMLLAQHFGIATVNGYSGQLPQGYAPYDPAANGYAEAIDSWLAGRGVTAGVCSYDASTATWSMRAAG